jgi:hypothetical protein
VSGSERRTEKHQHDHHSARCRVVNDDAARQSEHGLEDRQQGPYRTDRVVAKFKHVAERRIDKEEKCGAEDSDGEDRQERHLRTRQLSWLTDYMYGCIMSHSWFGAPCRSGSPRSF